MKPELWDIARAATVYDDENGCGDVYCNGPHRLGHKPEPHHFAAFYQAFTPDVVLELVEDLHDETERLLEARRLGEKTQAELHALKTERTKPSARELAPVQIPAYVDDIRRLCQSMTTFCDNVERG